MITSHWDVLIGFWLGVIVITLISIARTALYQTLYLYDWYILVFSVIVLVILVVLKSRSADH
jgi:hypothetical protein